jgi:hypothetical protein
MTALAGSLLSIGLEPLLALLHQAHKTGSLSISDGPLSGRVFLEGGRVVGAVFESQRGVTAFDTIVLALGAGEFAFDENVTQRELNFMVEPHVLEERLHRLSDERARFARLLPSLAAVPSVTLAGNEDEQVTLSASALRLLLEVDGRRSVFDLARRRGLVPAARAVSSLVEAGLVTFQPGQSAEPAGSSAAAATANEQSRSVPVGQSSEYKRA